MYASVLEFKVLRHPLVKKKTDAIAGTDTTCRSSDMKNLHRDVDLYRVNG